MDQIRICLTHALSFIVQMSVIVVVSPYFIPPAFLIISAYVYYSLMVSSAPPLLQDAAHDPYCYSMSKRVGIFDASNQSLVRQSSRNSERLYTVSSLVEPSDLNVDS